MLKDCIARDGSVAGGLRYYVGSTSVDDGYGAKVLVCAMSRAVATCRSTCRKRQCKPRRSRCWRSTSADAQKDTSEKRVHVTIDNAKQSTSQDNNTSTSNGDNGDGAPKHVASAEFGA